MIRSILGVEVTANRCSAWPKSNRRARMDCLGCPLGRVVVVCLLVLAVVHGALAQQPAGSLPDGWPVPPTPVNPPPPASVYPSMEVIGFFADWSIGGGFGRMRNISAAIWQVFMVLPAGTHQFKLVGGGSTAHTWGAPLAGGNQGMSGSAAFGSDVRLTVEIPEPGRYLLLFQDSDGKYSFLPAEGQIPPLANAGPDQIVPRNSLVVFNGNGSFDPDGTIVSHTWSNGLAGPLVSQIYHEPGVYVITLTVTDNSGNTGTDDMTLTVLPDVSVPGDFRSDTIYYVEVSRFFNADPDNDFYCRERVKEGDPHWRGDFRGLMLHLDYIRELGFTTICLNPIMENRGPCDFDGLHPYDWSRPDPRLTSPDATLLDVIDAAHQRGLKVMLGVVLNHSSDYGIRNQVWVNRLPHKFFRQTGLVIPRPYVFNLGNYRHPFRMDNDNPRAPEWFQDFLFRDPWGQGPLTDPLTGTVLPQQNYRPDRFFGTDETTLDKTWYHRNGWLSAMETNVTAAWQGKHVGSHVLDLATENWRVKNYFIDTLSAYLDAGVDALRIELAGHIDRDELLPIVNALKEKKVDLFVAADVAAHGSGYGMLAEDKLPSELTPWWYTRTGNDPLNPDAGGDSRLAVGDACLQTAFARSVTLGHYNGLDGLIRNDWVYGDPLTLLTYFHGPRTGPGADRHLRFAGEQWRAANAYTLLWTIRGIPGIIHGEEIEFQKGGALDLSTTAATLEQTGKAYFGTHLEPANLPNTVQHPLARHIRRLNLIRQLVPALQMGTMLNGTDSVSGMTFVRDYQNGFSYVVVGLAAFIEQDFTVTRVRPGTYTDAITGAAAEVATDTRSLSFTVKANSAGIWVLNGPGKIGADGLYLR